MKKYKVISKFPGFKKDKLVTEECLLNTCPYSIDRLINEGFIEEVVEESLEEKLFNLVVNYNWEINPNPNTKMVEKAVQIAKDHFNSHPEELGLVSKEEVLECVDKAVDDWANDIYSTIGVVSCIRKALYNLGKTKNYKKGETK